MKFFDSDSGKELDEDTLFKIDEFLKKFQKLFEEKQEELETINDDVSIYELMKNKFDQLEHEKYNNLRKYLKLPFTIF